MSYAISLFVGGGAFPAPVAYSFPLFSEHFFFPTDKSSNELAALMKTEEQSLAADRKQRKHNRIHWLHIKRKIIPRPKGIIKASQSSTPVSPKNM